MRLVEVCEATGLGRNTLYRWMNEGRFPLAFDLGGCRIGWRQSEIRAWIESRPRCRSIRINRGAVPWNRGAASDKKEGAASSG
ncbi:MAG TPA: AlpA family phage regulatory protein [Vicinamibacterales bacterium]|nr:AlpA family phage regulatory protein [Vicinamibacterales bacterium]